MSSPDTNLMEGDILAEENLNTTAAQPAKKPEVPKKPLPKIDPKVVVSKISKLKRPKPITIIAVFFVIILSFTALIVLEDKIPQEKIVDPDVLITSPRPTPKNSEELNMVLEEVSKYQDKVNNLNESYKNYPLPKVDLNVKF